MRSATSSSRVSWTRGTTSKYACPCCSATSYGWGGIQGFKSGWLGAKGVGCGAWNLGSGVGRLGFRAQGQGPRVDLLLMRLGREPASGIRVQDLGTRFQGSGFGVWGSGFRVQGSEFRLQDSGLRVQG